MTYADNKFQIYYLVIAKFTINYKQLIMFTDIKLEVYYPIFIISTSKCENLYKNWFL